MDMKMKKNLALSLILGTTLSFSAQAGVMAKGAQSVTVDYSRTNANKLWKGTSSDAYMYDANNSANAEIGETTFQTYAVNYSRGLGFGLQMDFRLGYATSIIEDGSHPGAGTNNNGPGPKDIRQKDINEVSLKLTYNVLSGANHSTNVYFQYKHPGASDTPTNPTFLALNDYSSHMVFGVTETYSLNKLSFVLDLNYAMRSTADKLEAFDLPGDQINLKLDLPYQFSDRVTAGTGLAYRHTTSGPDIGGTNWTAVNTANSVGEASATPAFFAIRERFVGYSMFATYYMPKYDSYVGVSRFRKLQGRNTDQSRTWAVFYGINL